MTDYNLYDIDIDITTVLFLAWHCWACAHVGRTVLKERKHRIRSGRRRKKEQEESQKRKRWIFVGMGASSKRCCLPAPGRCARGAPRSPCTTVGGLPAARRPSPTLTTVGAAGYVPPVRRCEGAQNHRGMMPRKLCENRQARENNQFVCATSRTYRTYFYAVLVLTLCVASITAASYVGSGSR